MRLRPDRRPRRRQCAQAQLLDGEGSVPLSAAHTSGSRKFARWILVAIRLASIARVVVGRRRSPCAPAGADAPVVWRRRRETPASSSGAGLAAPPAPTPGEPPGRSCDAFRRPAAASPAGKRHLGRPGGGAAAGGADAGGVGGWSAPRSEGCHFILESKASLVWRRAVVQHPWPVRCSGDGGCGRGKPTGTAWLSPGR